MGIRSIVFFTIFIQMMIDCYLLELCVLVYGNEPFLPILQIFLLVLVSCIDGIKYASFWCLWECRIELLMIEDMNYLFNFAILPDLALNCLQDIFRIHLLLSLCGTSSRSSFISNTIITVIV